MRIYPKRLNTLFILSIISSLVLLAAPVSASSNTTTISGMVTYLGQPAPNVRVVTSTGCGTKVGYADNTGFYKIEYNPNYGCVSPVNVQATAYYGKFAGGGSTTVDSSNNAVIDIEIIKDVLISGKVTYDGVPVSGVKVYTDCNGAGSTYYTSEFGDYGPAQFNSTVGCVVGSPVTVNTEWNGLVGSSSASVGDDKNVVLSVIIPHKDGVLPPNVIGVPEMDISAIIGAGAIVGLVIIIVRRESHSR